MGAVKSLIAEYNNITHVYGTEISNNLPIWTGGIWTGNEISINILSNGKDPNHGNNLTWRWSDGSKFGSFMNCQRSSFNGANDNDRTAINEATQVLTQSSNACFWTSHDASNEYPYICQVDFRKSKIHTELNIFGIIFFGWDSRREVQCGRNHTARRCHDCGGKENCADECHWLPRAGICIDIEGRGGRVFLAPTGALEEGILYVRPWVCYFPQIMSSSSILKSPWRF